MRLIDADELKKQIKDQLIATTLAPRQTYGESNIMEQIDAMPTVDPVEVVRCRDCKHCFLEIIEGKKVFSCLYRMGTLDLNGYCDCGAKMDVNQIVNQTVNQVSTKL